MQLRLDKTEYSIAAVSKLTGVSCHALRVWERRYGFPKPERSPAGHRRYGVDQVRILCRLSERSQAGHSIGDLVAEFREGKLVSGPDEQPAALITDDVESGVVRFLNLMWKGEVEEGVVCFERLEAMLQSERLVCDVIARAFTETGEHWYRRKCSVFQERCVTVFLRRKLEGLIEQAQRANERPTRKILVGTVQGDRHEGGVLIANFMMERAGWRVINLGNDLPVIEYMHAIEHFRPDALALSFVLSRNINKRFQELSQIKSVPVFVGGRSILNYQGLARRSGLIPVPGPIQTAIDQIRIEFNGQHYIQAAKLN